MGAACCVAARDRTIPGSSSEVICRNFRHSPTWSFRWDSRVGVASEETSIGWLSDMTNRSDMVDVKSATDISAHVSDGGNSLENDQSACRKSPLNQEDAKNLRNSISSQLVTRHASTEVKQSSESPPVSDAASNKSLSPMHLKSSVSFSPLSSQSHHLPPSPTTSPGTQGSSEQQQAKKTLEIQSLGRNSLSMNSILGGSKAPSGSLESTRGSYGQFSDGLSAYAFSEVMSPSQRDRWSFDSDSCSFNHGKSRNSGSLSMDLPTCGICSKLLNDKSARSSQKIMAGNELSVVAVLMCGHVYHAECLEAITPEFNKYDPACPVCTFGEKQTMKLTEKMLKAERDHKARSNKKSRNRVIDTDGSFDFANQTTGANERKSPKLNSSSSLKISGAKPFLKRHFSFGSKGGKTGSENPCNKKKGLLWTRYSKG